MHIYECVSVNSRIGLRYRVVRTETIDQAAQALYLIAARDVYGRNAYTRGVERTLTRNNSTVQYTGWIGYDPGESLCVKNGKNIHIIVKEKT